MELFLKLLNLVKIDGLFHLVVLLDLACQKFWPTVDYASAHTQQFRSCKPELRPEMLVAAKPRMPNRESSSRSVRAPVVSQHSLDT